VDVSAVTPLIRDAIRLRYRLLPYFYTLLWQAHADDEPMLRPTFLDHEHDKNTFAETDDFLMGRDLLVASVVDEGQRERAVYLPDNSIGWCDFYSGEWFAGGQTISRDAPLDRLPLLVRAGAALPQSARLAHADSKKDMTRELHVYPAPGAVTSAGMLFEDDGESHRWQQNQALWLNWEIASSAQRIDITITQRGEFKPAWKSLDIVVPEGEAREVWINGERTNSYLI